DVVIGAGLVGGWAATVLADRGRDVALVDARFPAAGASGRNAGFVMTNQREHYHDLVAQRGRVHARALFELVAQNVALMRALAERFGLPIEPGPVRLARDAHYASELQAWAEALDADGFEVEFGRTDPLDLGHCAFMRLPNDFCTPPARLVEAIVDASGATRYDHNEVYRVEATAGGRLCVLGRRAQIECDHVW